MKNNRRRKNNQNKSPFQVVKDFEAALCDYTGARYAVTTTSCTMALLLAVAWHLRRKARDAPAPVLADAPTVTELCTELYNRPAVYKRPAVSIPQRTYVSVPMSIIHAGGRAVFRAEQWLGAYQLSPLPVWDSARRFTSGMYVAGTMQCVSFHTSKILGDTQGGAILHDDSAADAWLRRARFDGRAEGVAPRDDGGIIIGWHCYMSPDVAARLMHRLALLPRSNEDLPNDEYPDLEEMEIFR